MDIIPGCGGFIGGGGFAGLRITGPATDEMFIRSLGSGILKHLDTVMYGTWNPKFTEVSIEVGVKPIAGLPPINLVPPQPK